jgi:hypothetical protein
VCDLEAEYCSPTNADEREAKAKEFMNNNGGGKFKVEVVNA